ncbi:uncharacterized protein LOC111100514 isoform X2 [Crassostrea virginica]
MLRSTLQNFKQGYRSLSKLCGLPLKTSVPALSSGVPQRSQSQPFSTEETHFLQIDCQEVCFRTMMADQDNHIMSKVGEKRPDVVLLEHLHESDFWCIIQNFMRRHGYTGSIEDSRHGRVKGVFIRNDLMGRRGQEGGTFYKSTLPDPY